MAHMRQPKKSYATCFGTTIHPLFQLIHIDKDEDVCLSVILVNMLLMKNHYKLVYIYRSKVVKKSIEESINRTRTRKAHTNTENSNITTTMDIETISLNSFNCRCCWHHQRSWALLQSAYRHHHHRPLAFLYIFSVLQWRYQSVS